MPCLKYFLSLFTSSFAWNFFPVKKGIFLSIYASVRYKYTYMEEMLSNVAGARQIFERWMEWEPDEQAWHSYINMELRYKETDRARNIYERYVMVHPEVKNWVKYAKFEERQSNTGMDCKKETPLQGGRGGGRFLNKILYREAPPCGPTPYPSFILFLTENVPHFVYLSD